MDTHNQFVLGALIAVAGVVVGAGSVVTAQVAFSGVNPNYANESVQRSSGSIDDRREVLDATGTHGAANSHYTESHNEQETTGNRELFTTEEECYALSSRREINCLYQVRNGEGYSPNEIPRGI